MTYAPFAALGVLLSVLVLRSTRGQGVPMPPHVASRVRGAAGLGAVLGAYLFELPADLLGWAARMPGELHAPIGGRTVLGGLLGGWLAVELAKRWTRHRAPTGDAFALPLAVGLAAGRLGCVAAGCCPGMPIEPDSPWAALSFVEHAPPRFPATLLELYFHAAAAVVLALLGRTAWLENRRLAAYLSAYALVRFGLEGVRSNPSLVLGLTYYQLLCLALLALAGGTLVARSRGPAARLTAT